MTPQSSPDLIPGRVTVGIPTYNRPDFAERAARSVLAQTYPDVELVVSDDLCPGDDSELRIEQLRPLATGGKTLRIVPQATRLGLFANFDACLRLASGEFFLLLGDDDVLHPQAIERLVAALRHPPSPGTPEQVGFAWCPCNIVEPDGTILWSTPPGPPLESPDDFLIALWCGKRGHRLSSTLFRTAEGLAVGGFQARFGDLCDTGIWGPIILGYPYVACVPDRLVDYTNHARSTTVNSSPAAWQGYANAVHDLLLARCQALGLRATERKLARHRVDHLFGVTLTILIQNIGRPGWIGFTLREVRRTPRILLNHLMLRRLLTEGWKIFRRKRSFGQPA